MTLSKPDQRSILIVTMFAGNAIREAQAGKPFQAGRAIGAAQQAAADIDDCETRDRARTLTECLELVLEAM